MTIQHTLIMDAWSFIYSIHSLPPSTLYLSSEKIKQHQHFRNTLSCSVEIESVKRRKKEKGKTNKQMPLMKQEPMCIHFE